MVKAEDITVLTVTYNSQRTIEACLDSIFKLNPGVKIIVVDNNSQDQTRQILNKYKNKITLLERDDNYGFSKSNNLGTKHAQTEYLVFLNPDTKLLEKDSLTKLVSVLEDNSEYGLIGPRLLHADGELQLTVRNLPTIWRAIQEYIFWQKGKYDFYLPECQELCSVETVVGACIAISKKLFDQIGGFNERYFLYYEDIDLCQKVLAQGKKVGYLPTLTVSHIEGVSGKAQKVSQLLEDSSHLYFGSLQYQLICYIGRVGNKLHGKSDVKEN